MAGDDCLSTTVSRYNQCKRERREQTNERRRGTKVKDRKSSERRTKVKGRGVIKVKDDGERLDIFRSRTCNPRSRRIFDRT